MRRRTDSSFWFLALGLALLTLGLMIVLPPNGRPEPSYATSRVVATGRVPVDEARRVFRVSTGSGAGSAVPIARVGRLVAFVTCGHVLRGSSATVVTDLDGHDFQVVGSETAPSTDAAVVWAVVDVQPLTLSRSVLPFGTRVFAAGWPCARALTLTEGFVCGRDPQVGQQFSAPVYLGNSGGAVLDESGLVVGLVQKMWMEDNGPIPHMAYFLPVAEFESWLADALTHVPKGPR